MNSSTDSYKDYPYIELRLYHSTYRTTFPYDDMSTDKLKSAFSKLLVCAGFPPSVIDEDDKTGEWRWVSKDEEVVEKGGQE